MVKIICGGLLSESKMHLQSSVQSIDEAIDLLLACSQKPAPSGLHGAPFIDFVDSKFALLNVATLKYLLRYLYIRVSFS